MRAESLTKAYTLYPSSWDRIREILGFRRRPGADFLQHMAIDDVTLTIRAGEKVAFIGRNGAGKSTLLKLITGLIEPTSGRLEIRGDAHALLQIGGGFHPELTGRQNAYAYLANFGRSGEAADRAVDDIIGFSELEEYIDQPLKTYSTGMQMRLIFAASTTIAPKLFVVDEVLGVGDGYFQHKSFGRIQELCERNGTTLLLVSHDIYSAAKLCERMIWIDRGRIKFDGDPKTALNLYESSIKQQEEQRLRKKAVLVGAVQLRDTSERRAILIELLPANGWFAGQVDLLDARLMSGPNELARLRMHQPESARGGGLLSAQLEIVEEGSSWQHIRGDGATSKVALADHGSVFQKGLMRAVVAAGTENLRLELQLASPSRQTLIGLVYDDGLRPRRAGEIDLAADRKPQSLSLPLDCTELPEHHIIPTKAGERHGTGDVRITEVLFFGDETPFPTTRLTQLRPFAVEIHLQKINPSALDIEIVVAFQRDGVLDCMRAFSSTLKMSSGLGGNVVRFAADLMPLGAADYNVTVLVAKAGYYELNPTKSFSINPGVIDVLLRSLQITVAPAHLAYQGTVTACVAQWSLFQCNGNEIAETSFALSSPRIADFER